MAGSFSEMKGLLSQMLASKGPGPGTCNRNHQSRGPEGRDKQVCCPWSGQVLLDVKFGEEGCKLF